MLVVDNLSRSGLHSVSFSLAKGECVAVQGPSGAGKSLLLRAIADLDPSQGRVSLLGTERHTMSGPHWRRQVGYVPAEPGWWADRTSDHFLHWPAMLPLARRLGLRDELGGDAVSRLSTGERQRMALLRALERQPKVLLLDEPTSALDAATTAAVEALLADWRAEGLALLWVSHDPAQATRVATRRLVVEQGRVREEGA
ncbi:MAG TPA: ATP-binding cassette domain-containing protein [Magnetospirillum sp.]|jgi:phosphate-transporting ATPase|nr:ATP-binding cassette domain-containing protein [Magnetospirillum sp.]